MWFYTPSCCSKHKKKLFLNDNWLFFFLLRHPSRRSLSDGLAAFRSFLQSEFSDENVEFWMACEDFKKTKNPVKMAAKAKKMYEDYIQSEGPREVRGLPLLFRFISIHPPHGHHLWQLSPFPRWTSITSPKTWPWGTWWISLLPPLIWLRRGSMPWWRKTPLAVSCALSSTRSSWSTKPKQGSVVGGGGRGCHCPLLTNNRSKFKTSKFELYLDFSSLKIFF